MQRVARLSGFYRRHLTASIPSVFEKQRGVLLGKESTVVVIIAVGQPDESLLPTGLTGRRSGSPLLLSPPTRFSIRPSVPSNRDIPPQRLELELLRAVHSTWFLRRRRLPRTNPGVTPRGAAWRRSHSCIVTSTSATRRSGEPGVRGV